MRIKKVSNNYRSSGIKHRDNRHDPTEPALERRSKKSTRRWCKGKVGVEHDYQEATKPVFNGNDYRWVWQLKKCTRCGKQYHMGITKEKI